MYVSIIHSFMITHIYEHRGGKMRKRERLKILLDLRLKSPSDTVWEDPFSPKQTNLLNMSLIVRRKTEDKSPGRNRHPVIMEDTLTISTSLSHTHKCTLGLGRFFLQLAHPLLLPLGDSLLSQVCT